MPEEMFSISATRHDDEIQLRLRGELDLAEAETLVEAARGADGAGRVHVVLSDLRFIDSSGVSALLSAAQLCRARGQSFTVTGAHGVVEQVFRISGIEELLRGEPAG
jgi:anti-anti-sigma factor